MAPSRKSALRLGNLFLLASAWLSLAAALNIDLCSSFNTASMARNVSVYQTNGLCHDFCIDRAAFAITQGNGCWCTDYYPDKGSTVSSSNCNFPCPAYPLENCGGDGLFGYIQLNQIAPSGTRTASSSSSTSSARITTVTASVTKTVQETASLTTETSTTSSSSFSTSSGAQTPTDAGKTTAGVTPTARPNDSDNDRDNAGAPAASSGLSTGAIVGIVVGVIVIVLIVVGVVVFFWIRRRKQNVDDFQNDPSVRGSSSGMLGSVRPEMAVNGGAPASPGSAANRNSTIQIDPRMDPFKQGLYQRSGSHESLNTLRDDHDYSRRIQPPKVLRAMNPDPEEG